MKLLLIFITSILLFGPCKSSKDTASDTAESKTETPEKTLNPPDEQTIVVKETQSDETKTTYNLLVSFISRGEGINGQAKTKLDDFIIDFEAKHSLTIQYEKINWGKEGERDYCFDLSNLSQSKQKTFITGSKTLLSTADQVLIYENKECYHKK